MSKMFLCLLALSWVLAGCAAEISGPSVRVKSPYPVYIDDGHGHDKGKGGKFCPPGQAKKGRC